jgi:hypothetical protein
MLQDVTIQWQINLNLNENSFSAGLGEAFDKKYQRLNLAAVKRKIFKK